VFEVVSDDCSRNFDGNGPRTGAVATPKVGVGASFCSSKPALTKLIQCHHSSILLVWSSQTHCAFLLEFKLLLWLEVCS
jgi:hypothetical protein